MIDEKITSIWYLLISGTMGAGGAIALIVNHFAGRAIFPRFFGPTFLAVWGFGFLMGLAGFSSTMRMNWLLIELKFKKVANEIELKIKELERAHFESREVLEVQRAQKYPEK